jgi:hypothetical protein
LDRNEDGIRGRESIEVLEIEGRGAVDQDEVVVLANWQKALPEAEFPGGNIHEFEVGTDQVLVGGE